jgi:hypothetical protein
VTNVSVQIDRTGLSFSGYVDSAPPSPPPAGSKSVPTISLAAAKLSAAYQFATPSALSSFTASLAMAITVTVDGATDDPPAEIDAAVSYDSTAQTWVFQGEILGMRLAYLYAFFDDSAAVMKILNQISIKALDIVYTYHTDGTASDLAITGGICLDVLELDLEYTHNGDEWKFGAQLGASSESDGTTLGKLLEDIIGSESTSKYICKSEQSKRPRTLTPHRRHPILRDRH